jgi:hypothetical protein
MTIRFPGDADPAERLVMRRWRRAGCPPPEWLLPAQEGALPEPARAAVLAHLERCPGCAELATALSEAAETLTGEEAARIAARVRRARQPVWRRWMPSAAAALLLTTAGAGYLLTLLVRSDPPAPVQAPTAATDPDPAAGLVLPLSAPAILLPTESLTLRGAAGHPYAAALDAALEPFENADYEAAEARLSSVVADYPDRPHGHFYLGVTRLLRGDADGSIAPLERTVEIERPNTSLSREATWYLAIALERTGRGGEAAIHLAGLCGTGTSRRDDACTALKQILAR